MNVLILTVLDLFLLYFSYKDFKTHEISFFYLLILTIILFSLSLMNLNFINELMYIFIILLFIFAYFYSDNLIAGFGTGDILIISLILFSLGFNYLFILFIIILMLFVVSFLFVEYFTDKKVKIAFLPFVFLAFNITILIYFIIQ